MRLHSSLGCLWFTRYRSRLSGCINGVCVRLAYHVLYTSPVKLVCIENCYCRYTDCILFLDVGITLSLSVLNTPNCIVIGDTSNLYLNKRSSVCKVISIQDKHFDCTSMSN